MQKKEIPRRFRGIGWICARRKTRTPMRSRAPPPEDLCEAKKAKFRKQSALFSQPFAWKEARRRNRLIKQQMFFANGKS